MIQPDYANPSAVQILRGAPNANWRKCWECGSESLHMGSKTPWVLCQHCNSQDTRLMKEATAALRTSGARNEYKTSGSIAKRRPHQLLHRWPSADCKSQQRGKGSILQADIMQVPSV